MFVQVNMNLSTAGLAKDCRLGVHHHFCCQYQISNPRPMLDSSSKTTWGRFIVFYNISKQDCLIDLGIFGDSRTTINGSLIIAIL